MKREELSILEVLERSNKPMNPVDVWKTSKHRDNIEEFYAELKLIRGKIKEAKKNSEVLITLK